MTGGRRMLLFLGVSAAMLMGLIPATAGATDYCVAPKTDCGGTQVPTVEQALDFADDATDADRVFLGATTYTAQTVTGFYYSESSSPVEIIGQGRGQTILTAPSASSFVMRLIGGPGTSVHDLTIQLPQTAAAGLRGLSTANLGRRIEIVEDQMQANKHYGVELVNGGTLEDSSVTLGSAQDTTGIIFETGGGAVRRSTASARFGLWSEYGGTIEHSRLTGSQAGVAAYRNTTAVSQSVIRFTDAFGAGIGAATRLGFQTTVKADGVTIVGPGLPNTFGVYAATGILTAAPVAVSLTNSIIRGASAPLFAAADSGGTAAITASYSDYDPSGNLISSHGGGASIDEPNLSNVGDAGFVDAAAGDYRLLAGSPLIDSGDPGTPQGLDLGGDPLVADGNGDGVARRDMGAFELQPAMPAAGGGAGASPDTQPPLITGFITEPSVFVVARAGTPLAARAPRGTRFRYNLSEPAGVKLGIQRRLAGRRQGGRCVRPSPRLLRAKRCVRYRSVGTLKRSGASGANRIRFTGRIGSRALRPGRYRALITATDTAGNSSTSKPTSFRIAG